MSASPRVVIIGAGIVGTNLADELASRGWNNITVVEQGPLELAGGSTSHAPGLVFQTNPSKTMTRVRQLHGGQAALPQRRRASCFNQVGGLELATTEARLQDLKRKLGYATSWGIEGRIIDPDECEKHYPLLNTGARTATRSSAACYVPTDGLASAARAVQLLISRTREAGVKFLGSTAVTGIEQTGGKVTGVETADGVIPADIVVSCAGFWGRELGKMVGMKVPLLPLAHQYVKTTPLPELKGRERTAQRRPPAHPALPGQGPVLPRARRPDRHRLLRAPPHARGHGQLPRVGAEEMSDHRMPSRLDFTLEDFLPAWEDSQDLLPALRGARDRGRLQRHLLLHARRRAARWASPPTSTGFFVAEAVWVTHSAGVAKADGRTAHRRPVPHRPARLRAHPLREGPDQRPSTSAKRPSRTSWRSTTSCTRCSPRNPRGTCGSARSTSGRRSWARSSWSPAAGSARTGSRPTARCWTSCRAEWQAPERDAWSAMFHSPISAAEAWKTRTAVALYDMTPLKRLEVTGPGALALLQRLSTGNIAKKPGAVTYCLLLDDDGGIRSDVTVARLAEETFQLGVNSNVDFDYLRVEARKQSAADPAQWVHVSATSPAAPAASACGGRWPAK